jgi:methyltransferase-like protein/ubiquinone/menaquinone biosynthesis C-methylase UbiE
MTQQTLDSYDDIPYPGDPIEGSHPDLLATIGRLRGLPAPAPDRCRVLELGCGDGGNLLPLAVALPGSSFLGIDLSRAQVEAGQQAVRALGLTNAELCHLNILDLGDEFGQFDYVLCHGVYSWVPPEVQEKILEVCSRNLTPQGVAYVGYNTYPGWHTTRLLRDMMLYHVRPQTEPKARLRQARELLQFLGECFAADDSPYARLMQVDLQILQQLPDGYLMHEHLDEHNTPVYFHEFIEWARAKGLQYLGEAALATATASNLRPEVEQKLRALARDVDQLEQYVDLLRNRPFRQTLLCHADVPLSATLSWEAVQGMYVSTQAEPVPPVPDLAGDAPASFRSPAGITLTTTEPHAKLALAALREAWPEALPFASLAALVEARLGGWQGGRRALAVRLLQFYLRNLVELHTSAPRLSRRVGARPLGSPWARFQVARTARVTDLRHQLVELTEFDRLTLSLLDGQRDRAALLGTLTSFVERGQLSVQRGVAGPAADGAGLLAVALDRSLRRLADNALLVGG